MEMEDKLPDGDANGEFHYDQLLVAERMAAERHGDSIQMGYVIERIIACHNREQPDSPVARMPAPPTPEHAGPNRLNGHKPPFRRRVDISDDNEPDRPVCPPCRPHLEFDDCDNEQKEYTEPAAVETKV